MGTGTTPRKRPRSTAPTHEAALPDDATSRLFDPALYHYDPVSRCGLPYDGIRSCSCGGTQFQLVMRGEDDRGHVICQACYADGRFRLKRSDDVIYGHLDARTKTVTYRRPLAELIAVRSRLGGKRP